VRHDAAGPGAKKLGALSGDASIVLMDIKNRRGIKVDRSVDCTLKGSTCKLCLATVDTRTDDLDTQKMNYEKRWRIRDGTDHHGSWRVIEFCTSLPPVAKDFERDLRLGIP
jgi:hypothetical protein